MLLSSKKMLLQFTDKCGGEIAKYVKHVISFILQTDQHLIGLRIIISWLWKDTFDHFLHYTLQHKFSIFYFLYYT